MNARDGFQFQWDRLMHISISWRTGCWSIWKRKDEFNWHENYCRFFFHSFFQIAIHLTFRSNRSKWVDWKVPDCWKFSLILLFYTHQTHHPWCIQNKFLRIIFYAFFPICNTLAAWHRHQHIWMYRKKNIFVHGLTGWHTIGEQLSSSEARGRFGHDRLWPEKTKKKKLNSLQDVPGKIKRTI